MVVFALAMKRFCYSTGISVIAFRSWELVRLRLDKMHVNRRWAVLLPVIFVTYSLAYLDRANFGFGAAAGMASDLQISSRQSSLLGALFFLGYFLFQIPGTAYAQTYSVRRLIFCGLIGWGVLAGATGLIANIHLLYIDRFLLGVVESAVLPSLMILLTRWFTRPERARVSAILCLGNPVTMLWMSVLSGYLAANVGWRMMFVIEGLPALIWAFVWLKLVSDRPAEAAWIALDERQSLEARLAEEQLRIAPVADFKAALGLPRVIALALQYMFWSFGVYGFVIWLPSILKMREMSMVELGWLSATPYLAAIIAELLLSTWSDHKGRRTVAVWPCLMLASAAFYGSYLLGADHFWISFILLVIAAAAMYAPYGPFFAYVAETLPANVSGGAIALINSMGGLGGFIATYSIGVLNGLTGSPGASYVTMAAALAAAAAITFFLPKK